MNVIQNRKSYVAAVATTSAVTLLRQFRLDAPGGKMLRSIIPKRGKAGNETTCVSSNENLK